MPSGPPFMAYVGNLPFSATDNDVGDFFYNGGCDIKNVNIKVGDDGRPRGFATVEFADRDSLAKALTATGANFGGRQLRVDIDTKKPPRGEGRGGESRREGGGFRDRDGAGATSQDGGDEVWSRAAPRREPAKVPPPAKVPKPAARRGEDGADTAGAAAPPAPPASRPIIKLQPRTLPVDAVGQLPGVPNQSIFGGGKPHDEKTYEVSDEGRDISHVGSCHDSSFALSCHAHGENRRSEGRKPTPIKQRKRRPRQHYRPTRQKKQPRLPRWQRQQLRQPRRRQL